MLPFSEWISECVNMLDCSWDAPLTDRRLAAWARLAHVMEEFRTAFAFDVSNITVSLGEPRFRHMLRTFSDQLDKLRDGLMPGVLDRKLLHASICDKEAKLWSRISGNLLFLL